MKFQFSVYGVRRFRSIFETLISGLLKIGFPDESNPVRAGQAGYRGNCIGSGRLGKGLDKMSWFENWRLYPVGETSRTPDRAAAQKRFGRSPDGAADGIIVLYA